MNPVARLWLSAVAVAGLGASTLFDGAPGLGWGLWTMAATGAVALCAREQGRVPGTRTALGALAVALAAGAAVTADHAFQFWIALGVAGLLAAIVVIAGDPRPERLGPSMFLGAPLVATGRVLAECGRRAGDLADRLGAEGWRPALRGGLLAAAVLAVFGFLLASADPIMAALRDGLVERLERLDFVPRLAFFSALFAATLGAGGIALRAAPPAALPAPRTSRARWTDVERLIVLGAVVALFAAFLALQVTYLFGRLPAIAGSGITFAEYARRGFAELTVVATLATLLVLGLERGRIPGARERWVRAVELLLVAELLLLLISAFRRVWLYETAYGFTTARLHAQVYMFAMAAALGLLALELGRGLDTGRLMRRAAALGAIAVLALCAWNHEASIVRWNLDRHAATGQLDGPYLVWRLSPNAVPAVIAALPRAPELRGLVEGRYAQRSRVAPCRWFEWNLRQRQAAEALAAAGIADGAAAAGASPWRCLRVESVR